MRQPYSCWLEVPGGVGWDRKGSPEPKLHVCGEDDTKRAVYNTKESIKEGDQDRKKKKKSTQEKALRTKELNLF